VRRSRRKRHPFLWAVGVLVVVFLILSSIFYVWPATNTPQRVDAIVVLGGTPSEARWQRGLALARAGFAPVLVQSDNPWTPCPRGPAEVKVICFDPEPSTTQGEAVDIARLARDHHWHRLLIVTDIPQVTRARIRIERCFTGTLLFNAVSPGSIEQWLYGVVYEWGALAKALTLQRACGSGPVERVQVVPPNAGAQR
jgi:hypothetical protein